MTRVPADVVLEMLRQDGHHVGTTNLRNWTFRGHITRTKDGYDLDEVIAYLDRRAEQGWKLTTKHPK